MNTVQKRKMKTIGIIGAGAGGLCALRQVLSEEQFTPLIWEQADEVGGTWIYTPDIEKDEYGYPIHSSMYKNLLTNLPKEVMAFPDFPFKEGEKSFIHHTEVLQYLKDYADHFKLIPWIKFRHRIELVEPVDPNNRYTKWRITVKNLKDGSSSVSEYDAVIVCNGHYFEPRYPDIDDLELFKGKKLHSHSYRIPDDYHGTKTVVLGASASGLDIALELAKVAEKVYLSHNHPFPFPSKLPPNVFQVKGVKGAKENGFELKDDTFIEADAIIYCTGYEYVFPFLSSSCNITVEDNQVKTLYKHMINSAFPTMSFIGIPFQICPFPLFDVQAQYIVQLIEGNIQMPLHDDVVKEMEQSSIPKKHYHKLGIFGKQQMYLEDLQREMKVGHLPQFYHQIPKIVILRLFFSLMDFKKFNYSTKEINDGEIQIEERLDGQVRNSKLDLIVIVCKRLFVLVVFNFPSLVKTVYSLGLKGMCKFF
ncbi:Flavin-containing monooxygenase FMO GS-OX-like 1 [Armadillidium nasatum]|uniref:Flavin-containing monooxygenase n=1 Tax=Armadillidium nasatum TaxID=96803 RepID=A0A5N5TMZ5_9CRUS|nr:Flavin-containing monooxygenase FMO GS-OX-like 1 [Armadillidium nasatum]